MTTTEVINIKVPTQLFREIDNFSKERYLSKGEFVRSAIVKFLVKLGFFKPFSLRMRELGEEMQMMAKTKENMKHAPEEEIEELRRIRKNLWRRNSKE